ncbi:hypothetical protein GGR51DRAFT_565170 [Nemania sp. FL0031]|nr:hypothetical protein GGR51DRAFT_565170 [Nemania sp. FL0031]
MFNEPFPWAKNNEEIHLTLCITAMIMPVYRKNMEVPLQAVTLDVGLDAAGIIALEDTTTVQQRIAPTGTAILLGTLVLCPGIHTHQQAPELNHTKTLLTRL